MMIRKLNSAIVVLMALSLITSPALADRDPDDNDRFQNKIIKTEKPRARDKTIKTENRAQREKRGQRDEREQGRIYKERGYNFDTRHKHNHYYPPRGYVIRTLPKNYHIAPYRGADYYFYSGIWYRRAGVSFSVVLPPVGIVVPVLPPYYTTVWAGATPYYYAGGVYYVWRPSLSAYEVVEPPAENEIVQEPDIPGELFIYPKEGQSEERQANDRYECYRWAADQTGFDPTQPGGDVSAEQHASKHADYQRAMTACLEGRGYSVK